MTSSSRPPQHLSPLEELRRTIEDMTVDAAPAQPVVHSQTEASTAFLRAARAGQLDKILTLLSQNVDINVSNANGLNAMHLASKDGHDEVVNVLLQRGAHIDAATKKGNTALHIAALAGQESVVRILVQHGAQVNIQSQNGFTPLYMAAQENHDSVVKFLLANGANQSLATEDGFTPLAVAMQQGHEKVVAVLLEADTGRVRLPALHIAAKKDDCKAAALLLENEHNPDVTSKSGFTPLHIAAHYGNEAVARLLLAKKADVNCAAKHNICPLHVAAKWGKANMVALLAENGAQVDARTRDGLTPLHCAARSGHEHVVDMLLERGAPISGKSKNGLAPLHMAAQGDHSDAARILLYHRAPVDDLTVDYLTALHVAAHCGHVKVAKLLLDRNADANARALNGFTPLHIACKKNRIKVVELLLKYGASISATTESGLTPLHVAAFMGCMNIVIYLLQHEASPDVPTVRGETPLHLAARANQTDIIRILLRNGAAVDARAREMQTALHIASRLGNVDIVLLLVQHGAQLDALTADNYNALHIAAKQHNHEVAAVLLEHGAPPNAVTKKGFTPLHLAAKYGNLKVANLLMSQKGAELDPRGKNGVTPLHVAAQYKHHAVATALLEKGADPKAAAKNGHTALHIAARKNQMETAAALMERGAVVDAESKAGCTPLHLAAHQGHAEMCSLLMEQGADAGRRAKSGLAALHLSAQEDHVPVAKILVNNGAKVDVCTKGGYTPLHVASHFGQTNMVKFLLESGADVQATTCHGYSALHHAAQQGHINIVNLLLEYRAYADAKTNNGQTPLDIAQKLGYVTVMDTLKGVSEATVNQQAKDDKYRPVAPETMYETFMSDSEEEGGEDTMLTDQPYRYLTVDDMKSLGDDSLPIDVTRDERIESIIGTKNIMEVSQESTSAAIYTTDGPIPTKAVNHIYNPESIKEGYCYNVESVQPKKKLQWKNFLVSFLVDARGGALRGCRGGGVRVIVPPLSAQQPTRITCRYVRAQRVSHMPPLMEGEALASRVLELGPVSAKFIGPIILEVPHFASLRGKEREIVILRSDNGTTWREHAVEAADCTIQDILSDTLDIDDLPDENGTSPARVTRILTHDFPQYFAVISRIRQEVHAIGPEGGMVSSSVVPQVQAVFPQGALTKKIKVGLQAQTIEAELTAKLLGRGVAVSPVVTVEPRRRKFHKAITLSMPAPRPHSQGMINQYTTSAPTLRLLCSISGGTNRAHWEDVTDSTPLTFVNDCVSFTTTVSARYWLMDCRNVSEATKMATELYREAIHVPFMARFVVYAKRTEQLQAKLRVFCVTDDREDKTLEKMERFAQVAKSRDVEVHEGKPVFLEFGGNFSPVAKSGDQPKLEFRALRENRLQLEAMVRGAHADAVARCQFMRELKRPKGEPPQTPICVLNIVLPEEIIPSDVVTTYQEKRLARETIIFESLIPPSTDESDNRWPEKLSDERITAMCNLLGMDWVPLAYELGISSAAVTSIRERGVSGAQQAVLMLQLWRSQGAAMAYDNSLELALCRIGREDVLLPQSVADTERRIQRNIYQERQSSEEIIGYKSPDSELIEKEMLDNALLEAKQEDFNKAMEKDEIDRIQRDVTQRREVAMDDSFRSREEAKYSPEEKSYIEDGSDREPSLSISEESEEEGVKKSVAERKIQITRKLSSGKVAASKQKKELKEEISEIKKQINPEIKKFHVQKTTAKQDSKDSTGKISRKSSEESEPSKKSTTPIKEHAEPQKVLPKAGPRHLQKHVRNDSMIRFTSGDFSDIKVPQKKPEEKVVETKASTVTKKITGTTKTEVKKETTTKVVDKTKTVTTTKEVIKVKDVSEAPVREKISSFKSKISPDKSKPETAKVEKKIKLTEEALKRHSESQKPVTEYTEEFIKDQIKSRVEMTSESIDDALEKHEIKQPDAGSPDLVSDFAADLMKAEETFRASADYTTDKYTETYYKEDQEIPKTFTKTVRTDSTIVQFSSEEDSEFLKKSSDSETETESQIVTVKQQEELFVKKPLKIHIERTVPEEVGDFLERDTPVVTTTVRRVKSKVDSLEDSLRVSSEEDKEESKASKVITTTDCRADFSETHGRSDSMGSDFSKKSTSDGVHIESSRSPKHLSQESPLPLSTSTMDKTDSLADSVQSTERDVSYISQSESKVYSKESRPTRSDSLDEASQFSDMEETQIGAHMMTGAGKTTAEKIRHDTMKFLEQETVFSTSELHSSPKKKIEKVSSEEPMISAKARQFIETVPEDDSSVQECFFSKRIYSDSLEDSEQYATDTESRRPSEADSLKSDKSDLSGKDAPHKMSKISSEIEEGIDENVDVLSSDKPEDEIFQFVKVKQESKEVIEVSDAVQETLFKKMTPKRHSRNESISIIKLSSDELKDSEMAKMMNVPPEIPQRATEFQMFVTEATDDLTDERISSFEREELSDKISSESSREMEISDKKLSDGGVSDKISSEDAVTDKASTDSGGVKDSILKLSSDTLLGADARSPELVESDHDEELPRRESPSGLRKIEKKFSGLKEMGDTGESLLSMRSESQTSIPKRESLSSTGDGSFDRLGKRISDAHSLTESKDLTFEESEDSTPPIEIKHDIENKAREILEPIYDKAIKTVRGDSLDDVEPFCMDQETEPTRLPGILESGVEKLQETTVSKVTVIISGDDDQARKLSLSKEISKDGEKDYSVHSSPDEVEEKICTDTESELDQAKVLEIIEPTSECDNGFVPTFDTSKLKQDSLDDADDLFAEKEGIFEDMEEFARQQFSSLSDTKLGFDSSAHTSTTTSTTHQTTSTIQEFVTKSVESPIIKKRDDLKTKSGEVDTDSLKSAFSLDDKSGYDINVSKSVSETGVTSSIKSKKEDHHRHSIKSTSSHHEHHITDLLSDASATLAAAVGVEIHPDDLKGVSTTEHNITELLADASCTLAASVGLEIKPEDIADLVKDEPTKHGHAFTELLSDSSSTLAAAVGIDVKSQDIMKTRLEEAERRKVESAVASTIDEAIQITRRLSESKSDDEKWEGVSYDREKISLDPIRHEHAITELLSDSSSTLAAAAGIDVKPEVLMKSSLKEEKHKVESVIASTVDDAAKLTRRLSESKIDENFTIHEFTHTEITKREHAVTELLSDSGSTLAATAGINVKPEELMKASLDEEEKHKVESAIASIVDGAVKLTRRLSESKIEETTHESAHMKITKHEHAVTKLLSDSSSTLAATAGIDVKAEDLMKASLEEEDKHKVESAIASIVDGAAKLTRRLSESKIEETTHESTHIEITKHEHAVTELLSDSSSTLAATAGIDVKPVDLMKASLEEEDKHKVESAIASIVDGAAKLTRRLSESKIEEITHESTHMEITKHEHAVTELLSDSSSTLAATAGIDVKPEDLMKASLKMDEKHKVESSIASVVDGAAKLTRRLSKTEADIKQKADASPELSPVKLEDTDKIVSELKDLNRADRRCSDLLEGISQPGGSAIRIDTSHVTPGLSLKFSKTPPPSPVDLMHRTSAEASTVHQKKSIDEDHQSSSLLSPSDARVTVRDHQHSEGDIPQGGYVSDVAKVISASASPKSPTRHHADNISFVNVETLTMHPKVESSTKALEDELEKLRNEIDTAASGTTILSKKETTTHQILGKEIFSEKKLISTRDSQPISVKIESQRQISGEEYELTEKETFEKVGDATITERSSVEREQKASAERRDIETQKTTKKSDDDAIIVKTHKEYSEAGLYSGRQSKSEEKMTAIDDDVSKKTEVSYSERDLSHEQWGKEYFAERSELETMEESDAEFSHSKDVYAESTSRTVERDEKVISEEQFHKGEVVSSTAEFSKEESVVESKEHDDMSSDQDLSFRSEVIGKKDSFDEKSDMSPKSKSRSLKKEEVYEVDFIKEIKISTSQKSKGSSQEISMDTHSEAGSDFPEMVLDERKMTELIEKKVSPVLRPEEHIQEHVWEVPLQQQEYLDEIIDELPQNMKSSHDEPRSLELDFASQSDAKSFTSGSDLGITTITSDSDLRTTRSGASVTSSDDTYQVEVPSDTMDSLKDSMIKSRESVETEYMIKSIDSQDAETLQKSMDSVTADITMQHSDIGESSEHKEVKKLLKEKSLEDICSSGYDTDLSSAEFRHEKLETTTTTTMATKPQPLADLEKTIDEVKQSLEAAHGEIINEKSDGSIKYKQSPSEFEIKLIPSPDRPEVIHEEEPPHHQQHQQQQEHPVASVPSHDVEGAHEDKKESGDKKESDSSSKHDDTYLTSDDEKDTAQEKEKTQLEYSDLSTGLESGPTSLLDTETELASDKEESSPKFSPEGVKLRPVQKHLQSAHIVADRRSTSDVEGWSSSGESHYQSFEHTESPHSRPLSSDVEVLLTSAQSTAEYHSALMTQEYSTRSLKTSKEYVTAASTLSSGGSVKSLDSESSGHVASLDISDASETLVPSAAELREEMTESGNFSEQTEIGQRIKPIAEEDLLKQSLLKEDVENDNVQFKLSPEIIPHTADSNEPSEEGSLDEEINDVEIVCKMKRSHEMSFQPKELLPEKFPSESFSESTDIESDLGGIPESESQVFSMSKIETGPSTTTSSQRHIKEATEEHKSTKSVVEPRKSFEISEKVIEYRTSSVVYKTPEKKANPAEIIETKVVTTIKTEPQIVTHYSSPKKREIDYEAIEACIIPKGTAEYEEIVSTQVIKSQSGTTVVSTTSERKITEPYPLDSKQSSSSSLKFEEHLSTPQTPQSNPSQSSESTDSGREYVLDDMYEMSEEQQHPTDSRSEISITTEERTLYDTQKAPDSPSSEEFEMVDKPSEMDDFVVIEEVAREASEFDAEGKSLTISKMSFVKKHDEEVENYLSQTAKKPASDTEYSTSGSLSEEELGQYELEQRKLRAQENAEIEAGKKWIQMQFEGDLAAQRYEYERGPLEDIKEEEMTDFDASRIGSFASQKGESVGSYGSIKNSYGSISESADALLRKRYMMRSSDQDDVSVSSLQEFENLEQILSLEAYQHSSSSQDSLNGSLPKRYHRAKNNTQGDDMSVSSLKEFEGLESACLEALKIEIQAKQKEALLLSQDGRLSSASLLDMERRSYSHGSSESSPPQKSGSSPGGQKSGSPSQKSGSPGQKSGSPGQKGGSPGQKFGSPSQKAIVPDASIKKMIDQQMAVPVEPDSAKVVVSTQKTVYDNKGAFYVPEKVGPECTEGVCMKKSSYECTSALPPKTDDKVEVITTTTTTTTTTRVIEQKFVNGKKVSESIVSTSAPKGVDIPGAVKDYQLGEYGSSGNSGSFPNVEVGSGDYGSEFSSSITSLQSDTESLVTMMEKPPYDDGDDPSGSLENIAALRRGVTSPRQQLELDLTSSRSVEPSISPMSGKSGSGGAFSSASKHFTDPASGSWSGLDEDMSSSGSFSRVGENDVTLTSTGRAKEEDLMLGSTDSLEQTSSNATRATYNYEVDTPMTGSLTSAGSNTMVSSLDTLEPVTAFFERGEKALGVSSEDCFTMEHSGSEHLELDSDENGRPQVRERTIMMEGRQSSEEGAGQSGATFFIGDSPIVKGDKTASTSESGSDVSDAPPVAAQRKSLSGSSIPIMLTKKQEQPSKKEGGDRDKA